MTTNVAAHWFVDESFSRDYYVVASAVSPANLHAARRDLAQLVLPGQRRLHMYSERDSRRRQILNTIAALGITAVVYHADGHKQALARRRCLEALIEDASAALVPRLVLEWDESTQKTDQATIYRATQQHNCPDLSYVHLRAHEEILLCAPDAIAWAWARGGTWRELARPLITAVRAV